MIIHVRTCLCCIESTKYATRYATSLKKFKTLPIYKLLDNTGPRHKPIFKVGVKIHNLKFINSTGHSKKEAEQKAAKLFLKKIGL